MANLTPAAKEIFDNSNPTGSAASYAIKYAASLENVFMVLSVIEQYLTNWKRQCFLYERFFCID